MRYRVYCMNYEPNRLTLSRAQLDALMDGADVHVAAKHGIPVGSKFDSILGKRMRCVAHEHHGKIAVMEDDAP